VVDWLRRNPGLTLLGVALVVATALYAPTLGRGLVNYDDPWLVENNFVVRDLSWSSINTILFDLDSPKRWALAPEYLPVRDLSIMLDYAIWGDHYGGFHVTNLVIYLSSIALVFAMLDGFGIDRRIAGLAVLVWAVHPSHAESVAWITERKGLLGVMFASACGLGYARFRAGRSARWLVMAVVCAVLGVWSKAPAAFAIASLAGLELVLPELRQSWRRSLVGLGAIGIVALAAFVPVVVMATSSSVVGGASHGGRIVSVLGAHGFYVELAAMAMPNALSYPISTSGPSIVDLVVGAVGLAAIIAAVAIPKVPREVRAGGVLWLFGWLPASHLILPLQMIFVADRYALLPTIGLALAVAAGICRIPRIRGQVALAVALVAAASLRTLDAQGNWASPRALWTRAVESNPDDPEAWSFYAEALASEGDANEALAVTREGLQHVDTPRLRLREALLVMQLGHRDEAIPLFRRAATAGDPRAMADLALLEVDDPAKLADALDWARRAVRAAPTSAHAHRTHGKVALASDHPDEAYEAFLRAYALEPTNLQNRFNLGLVLIKLGRRTEAEPHLQACLADPALASRAAELLHGGS
jgi:hypothetical protein